MDFSAEEELCQQAYEVWLHYACPACDGSVPPTIREATVENSSPSSDGPCSVLPAFFSSSAYTFNDNAEVLR